MKCGLTTLSFKIMLFSNQNLVDKLLYVCIDFYDAGVHCTYLICSSLNVKLFSHLMTSEDEKKDINII